MTSWSEEEVERTLEEIRKRSITDPDFRDLALSDSAAAIAKVTPKSMPGGYQVKFIDNSGPVKSFVLPDPAFETEELSDAELEAVAGGSAIRTGQTPPTI